MSINVKIQAQYEEFMSATAELKNFFGGVMDGMKGALKDMSDQAKADMKGHESASEQFANVLKGSMSGVTGAVEGVKIAWAQLAVVFAAGAFLKKAVDETVAMTVEAQKLGRELGVSATQASYLKAALGDVNSNTAEYTALNKGLTQQLSTHERELNKMGLATRDANGDLKDSSTLMLEALEVVRGYKEGVDRNVAAQRIFGQSAKASAEILDLTAEGFAKSKEKADAFNLAVGKESVEEATKYRAAMNDMNDIMDAVMRTVGEALLPVLNDLAEWFSDYGPTALLAIKIAIDIVISLFKGLAFAVKVLWEVCVAGFNGMVIAAGGFAKVFTALFAGDFAGAKAAAESMMGALSQNVGAAFDKIVAHATETRDSLADMWGKTINGGSVTASGSEAAGGDKTVGKTSSGGDAAARRAQAEKDKIRREEYAALMEDLKGQEQAAKGHWDQVIEIQRKALAAAIAMYGEGSKQAIEANNRIRESEVQAAAQHARIEQMKADATQNMAIERIAIEERSAQSRLQIGQITMAQMLDLERQFEERRYALDRDALQAKADSNANSVEQHAQYLLQLEELELQHQGRVAEIGNQAAQYTAQKQEAMAQTWGSAMAQMAEGMLNQTMSLKQALGSIVQQMAQQFMQQEAIKLARYMFGQNAMTMATVTGNAIRVSSDVSSARISTAATADSAGKNITSKAASVFAGVYDAIAQIPYVGPFLAPVMAVAAFGAVSAYAGKVASAEGGYDIPAGVNPVTQLHEKEMVLPAKHADVIRGMAGDGGEGAAGQPGGALTINISTVDARGMELLLKDNAAGIVKAIRGHTANGAGSWGG